MSYRGYPLLEVVVVLEVLVLCRRDYFFTKVSYQGYPLLEVVVVVVEVLVLCRRNCFLQKVSYWGYPFLVVVVVEVLALCRRFCQWILSFIDRVVNDFTSQNEIWNSNYLFIPIFLKLDSIFQKIKIKLNTNFFLCCLSILTECCFHIQINFFLIQQQAIW